MERALGLLTTVLASEADDDDFLEVRNDGQQHTSSSLMTVCESSRRKSGKCRVEMRQRDDRKKKL